MKPFLSLALILMTIAATGCTDNRYPISGETCGPKDPVHTLHANDCTVTP